MHGHTIPGSEDPGYSILSRQVGGAGAAVARLFRGGAFRRERQSIQFRRGACTNNLRALVFPVKHSLAHAGHCFLRHFAGLFRAAV